ncbi:hypothetical protein [Dietzia sp. SYD-A1]|uniref:hypothetical protein n=1 Tax=Dietzia sp. SYD-A1 TaxID=2780141 RepID=UPI001891BD9A|nr:hypothetical protein [Dietzia sp. SYD-A1]
MSDAHVKIIVAVTAAVSALVVALVSAWIARVFTNLDRKRTMYGEAYRTALEWREMLYRVRRRDNMPESDRLITDRFHDLEERLDFYEGWIGSESKYMARSYRKLVRASKSATLDLIREAWEKEGKTGNADPADQHPPASPEVSQEFLKDVRGHLSMQPWRWMLVVKRNWEDES